MTETNRKGAYYSAPETDVLLIRIEKNILSEVSSTTSYYNRGSVIDDDFED